MIRRLGLADLLKKGDEFIALFGGQKTLDFSDQSSLLKSVFQSIKSHIEIGKELLLVRYLTMLALMP